MAPKVLVVLTSHNKLPNGNPTGWYLPEFAHPYHVLSQHAEIVVASPAGGVAPLAPASVEFFKDDPVAFEFLTKHEELWSKTEKLSTLVGRSSEFAALFYPGGHGPMFDLAVDADSHRLINEFADAGKPVAAVCHGPIAFAFVKRADGTPFLAGAKVTGFSNSEEEFFKTVEQMPFLLETEVKKAGARYEKADNLAKCVVVDRDGKLITGQNPASAQGVAEELAKSLGF